MTEPTRTSTGIAYLTFDATLNTNASMIIQQKLDLYDEYIEFLHKDENFEEKLDFLLLQKKRKFHHKLERTFKTLITPELGEVIESDYRNIVDKREYDYQCLMQRFKNKKRKYI